MKAKHCSCPIQLPEVSWFSSTCKIFQIGIFFQHKVLTHSRHVLAFTPSGRLQESSKPRKVSRRECVRFKWKDLSAACVEAFVYKWNHLKARTVCPKCAVLFNLMTWLGHDFSFLEILFYSLSICLISSHCTGNLSNSSVFWRNHQWHVVATSCQPELLDPWLQTSLF